MIYKAVEVIWIFFADGHTHGWTHIQTDRGVPRGPHGPNKVGGGGGLIILYFGIDNVKKHVAAKSGFDESQF